MPKRKLVTKEKYEAIRQMYLDCVPMSTMAKRLHLKMNIIIDVLKDLGVQGPGL